MNRAHKIVHVKENESDRARYTNKPVGRYKTKNTSAYKHIYYADNLGR